MINHINRLKHAHIITIEDPIEYIHPQIKSRLTQREVGRDTESFRRSANRLTTRSGYYFNRRDA